LKLYKRGSWFWEKGSRIGEKITYSTIVAPWKEDSSILTIDHEFFNSSIVFSLFGHV
jgi:hypothetical protein